MGDLIQWAAPIASAIIVAGATGSINARIAARERREQQRDAVAEAARAESREWRASMDSKIDAINAATQTTMRTQLLHMAEKYLTRGWVTPEERAALYDMHSKYAALDANGYIDGYVERVMALPDKEI